jgi:hypothetical protein
MPATGFILPAEVDLEALIGGDFSTTINLYRDTTQTTAFDLTGFTVVMPIGALFTLATGAGLTISTPANGTVVAALTAAQTATVPSRNPSLVVHWQLKLTDGSGIVSYPLSGNFSFVVP